FDIAGTRKLTIVIELFARVFQFVPCRKRSFCVRMLAHDLLGAFAIIKQVRIGDLAFELLEPFAFTLNERLKIHGRNSENVRSRNRSPPWRTRCSAKLFCPRGQLWRCRNAW